MSILILLIGFIFGICLGSFAKALADRSLKKRSFWGRSHCESCKHTLSWYDLFPVFSYFFLRGKCRYCKMRIPKEYFFVELLAGVLVAFLWFKVFSGYTLLFIDPLKTILFVIDIAIKTFFITILVVLSITDIKKMFIPDRVMIPAIVIGFIGVIILAIYKIGYLYYSLVNNYLGQFLLPPHSDYFYRHAWIVVTDFLYSILMFLAIGGFFLSLIIITRGKGMGGGDVKLGAFIGLILGFPNSLLAIILSFITGATFAIGLILVGKKSFGQVIPFGPFLVLGSLISLYWGSEILNWYMSLSI